jgi:hypothetical protein
VLLSFEYVHTGVLFTLFCGLVCLIGGFGGMVWGNRRLYADYSSRDFDAHEAMQQVRAGNIPADWTVFRTRRGKVLLQSLAPGGLGLLYVLFFAWLLSNIYDFFIFMAILLCLDALLVFALWVRRKDHVLLITPEGFISGNPRKPDKTLRLKYRDVRVIQKNGWQMTIFVQDDLGLRSVSCSQFDASSQEVITTLQAALTHFKLSTASSNPSPSTDFDLYEALQQVRAGNIPAEWSVFRTTQKKLLTIYSIIGVVLAAGLFFLAIAINGSWPQQWSAIPWSLVLIMVGLPLLVLIFAFLYHWSRLKQYILLVTPTGFIYGNSNKPHKVISYKYRDTITMNHSGVTVAVYTDDLKSKCQLDFSWFSSSMEAIAALLAAFEHYRAGDEMVITQPAACQQEEQA